MVRLTEQEAAKKVMEKAGKEAATSILASTSVAAIVKVRQALWIVHVYRALVVVELAVAFWIVMDALA